MSQDALPRAGRPSVRGLDRGLVLAAAGSVAYVHRAAFATTSANVSAYERPLDAALYDAAVTAPILGVLVCAVSLARRRAELVSAARGPGSAIGGAVLGAGLLLDVWSRQLESDHLVIPSLVLVVSGVALLLGGRRLLGRIALPLAALAAVTPLPGALLQPILFSLQMWTVSLASAGLDGLGLDHEVLGDQILRNGVLFQVIEGCSGLKAIMNLALAMLLYADLTIRAPVGRFLLVLLAAPVGLFTNAIRVVLLVIGQVPAESTEHQVLGLATILLGVVLVAACELVVTRWAAWRSAGRGAPATASEDCSVPSLPGADPRLFDRRTRIAACVLIVAGIGIESVPTLAAAAPRVAWNIESLPETIDGWTARGLSFDNAFLGSVWFQQRILREYRRGEDSIRVFVGQEDLGRFDRTGYSPKTAIPSSGWLSITPLEPFALTSGDSRDAAIRVDRAVVRYPHRRVLVMHWRMGYPPWGLYCMRRWLGLDRFMDSPGARSPLVIRLESDVMGIDAEREGMNLRQFAGRVLEWTNFSGGLQKNE